MNPYKQRFAVDTKLRTLAEAMAGADVFLGLSVKVRLRRHGAFDGGSSVVFAMANPILKSPMTRPRRHAATSSWPPGVRISRTGEQRSRLPFIFRAHWTCAPPPSTKK